MRRVFWDELFRRSGAGVVMVFCKENAIVLPEKLRSLSPPPLLGAGPGALSFLLFACRQETGLPVPGQAGASCTCSLSSLSPLSARVCRRSPSLLPPSALSLSLSLSLSFSLSLLSLSCMHQLPAWLSVTISLPFVHTQNS